ncbi:MAG: Omp28-related outer membrane protein [Flavobacterium sp.]|nr:Omp28-related outer membrane protein [Flavobacterium sp.]
MEKKLLLLLFFIAFSAHAQTIVSTTPQKKKVILEEFTGINCQFCPSGHTIANTIKNANPNDVFLINIHVGGYSTPGVGQPDFRTSFGTAIANQSALTGYPAATVNRTAFTGLSQNGTTGTAMGRNNWTNAANQTRNQNSYVNVATTATIDVNTRLLTVFVEAYYTGASPVASNSLNVALLQNNTLGPQSSGGLGDNYPHQHRLVHLLTGQWGDAYTTTAASTLVTRTYTYTIPAAYKSIPAELGNFEIVAFVAEGRQKIISGNGTVPTYTGLATNDAKIKEVIEIAEQCVTSLQPKVEIQNNGQSNLTNLPISYNINGGTPQVFNWTGNLSSFDKTTVTLPSIAYNLQANNNLNISIPADDNATNNSGTITFVKAPETTTSNLTIQITLDQYGSETSWTLNNSAGETVASSPAYDDSAASGEYPQSDININVSNDCYTFTILDSFGDGLDGGFGIGSYRILSDGVVISGVEGGAFGSSDERSFSVASPLNTIEFTRNSISIFPNPSNGIITINTENTLNITISDITGKVVFSKNNVTTNESINLSNLQTGVYLAKMVTETGVEETKKIILN